MVGKLIYLATKKQLDNTLDLGDKNREKKLGASERLLVLLIKNLDRNLKG